MGHEDEDDANSGVPRPPNDASVAFAKVLAAVGTHDAMAPARSMTLAEAGALPPSEFEREEADVATREIDVFSEPPEIDTTRADEPPSRLERFERCVRCVRFGICVRRSLAACFVCSLLLFAASGIAIILFLVVRERRVTSAAAACVIGSAADALNELTRPIRVNVSASLPFFGLEAGGDCGIAATNSSVSA